MGAAASAGSDWVIVTSDNPRSEEPKQIINNILPGISGNHIVEIDRARAIQMAVKKARPGDLVLIAGKGHEQTQIVAGQTHQFDDTAMARAALGECS